MIILLSVLCILGLLYLWLFIRVNRNLKGTLSRTVFYGWSTMPFTKFTLRKILVIAFCRHYLKICGRDISTEPRRKIVWGIFVLFLVMLDFFTLLYITFAC